MAKRSPTPFQKALWEALGDRDADQVSADDLLATAAAKLQKDLGRIRTLYTGKMATLLLRDLGGQKPKPNPKA